MKKYKIYLDTSYINHLDAPDAIELQEISLKLWELMKKNYFQIFISNLVFAEINECSEPKRVRLFDFLKQIEYNEIKIDTEIENLAEKYVVAGIIPKKYEDDSLHLAAATVYNCNAIVTWNFKHMIKLKTILGINGINKLSGYNELEIISPESLTDEEE